MILKLRHSGLAFRFGDIGRPAVLAFIASITLLFTAFWFPITARAGDETPAVETIVERANCVAYYQGKDGRAQVSMVITDSQKRERRRQITILRRNGQTSGEGADQRCGDQKYYVYFHLPADVNKTVFIVWKHTDQDDDRWLYLPALDLVKRIAARDERTSFVGSHFFYEDVSGRNTNEDIHELIETTDNYFVLKNKPKNQGTVEFSHYLVWVHRKTFIPVKTEYYDRNGEKYRVYEALKVDMIQGYPTVTKARMNDLRIQGETVIDYSQVNYEIGLPEDIFTERYLRNPPREFLR